MRHCVPLPDAGAPEIITLSGALLRAGGGACSAARHRSLKPLCLGLRDPAEAATEETAGEEDNARCGEQDGNGERRRIPAP